MKAYWLPTDDNGKDLLLTNLSSKLPKYQATLSLDPGDVSPVQNDATFFHFCLSAQSQVAAYAQQWTAYKNAARSGTEAALGLIPTAPVLNQVPRRSLPASSNALPPS
jgi:hypothetical protein